ncbi:MAG TPA: hypothetical protein VIM60_12085 [Edaphobacter sp.]
MELFLNFIWLLISVLLVVHWIRVVRPTSAMQVGKAAVALVLLIVVLLPVISATDDLMNMAGMLEGEHAEHTVRRGEMPLLDIHQGAGMLNLAIFALLFIDLSFLSALRSRFVSRSQTVRVLKGFVKTFGMRPPPVASPATA